MIGRKARRALFAVVALPIVIGAGAAAYVAVTWVDEDLGLLAPHATTQSYAALARTIQAHPVSPEGFTFVVLGDTRSNMPVARNVLTRAASEAPAFILSTGDIVRHGTVDEYLTHHLPLVEATAPVPHVPAPGNHEDGPNRNFAAFKALYGADRFSFDYGGCRFVGVNTGDRLRLGWSDLRYLKAELDKPGARHKFVVIHIPPDYLASAGGRGFGWTARRFLALMRRMQVTHVFAGHIHGYATEAAGGIPHTITGGGGASLAKTLGPEGNVRNYVVVHVTPEGVKLEVVRQLQGQWTRSDIP